MLAPLKGFNSFYPFKVKDNPHIPEIILTSFKIFEEEKELKNFMTKSKDGIKLSFSQNFFSFEFAALDYTAPENNQYTYKLEGFDKDWHLCGTRRFANYTNVDPGEYTLTIKGSNNDQVWNDKGISLKIIIIPPFWKTWWFLSIAVLFFAIISYIIIHFSTKYFTLSPSGSTELKVKSYSVFSFPVIGPVIVGAEGG